MGAFKSAVITKKGQALLAKVVAGTAKFNFTSIKTSEGVLSGDLASKTGIGTVKQTADVASVIRQNDSNVKVSASFSNANLTTGYYVRNIGLYATDPQEGEILYSISVADESTATADWMPPFNGIGVSSLMVDLVTAVSNASSVNVTVDPTASATVAQIVDLQGQIDDVRSFVGYEEDNIYGVEVDFSSKKITRIAGSEHFTEGADFDALDPWGGRKRCILTDEGVRLAYRGDAGYTESGALTQAITIGETEYPIGTKVQVMVEQPIFYIKAVPVKAKNATSGKGKQYVKARFYISPTPKSGFSVPRAFYDMHGIPQDKIYLSAYEGSIYDTSATAQLLADEQVADFATDMLCSIAGAKPCSGLTQNLTRANVRKLCNNRGEGWQSHNIFAMAVTEWLFMVEYASLDPQRKVGQGVSTFTDDGATNMAVVTGATAGIGNGSGIPDGGESGKCSVTYRGEENLWGNIWTWLDCVNILAKGVNEVWVTKIGTAPVDNTTEGYECLDAHATHSNGYVSSFGIDPQHPEILIPTEASGNDTFADYVYQNYTYDSFFLTKLGGHWNSGSRCGFSLTLADASSRRDRNIGGRLLYVPQSKVA
ncbi:MAG: hypothetical protein IJV71_00015 [Lachnospiraceae bacterium]|nr:hypothetical protein [Lachnospiraceae bacterium]